MEEEKKSIYFDNIDKNVIFTAEPRMSKAHIFMIAECTKWIAESKEYRNKGGNKPAVYVIPKVRIDKLYPDITTDLFDVECETGLKHSYEDLKDRILRNPKMVIVVTPNKDIKKRYERNCKVRKQKLKFCSMGEYPATVHSILKNLK